VSIYLEANSIKEPQSEPAAPPCKTGINPQFSTIAGNPLESGTGNSAKKRLRPLLIACGRY